MVRALLFGISGSESGHLSAALEESKFEIERAPSTARALEALARSQPNLVLVETASDDPGLVSLCRRLREASEVPIVVCAMDTTEDEIVRALEAGADDYLLMPVRPVELVARLRAVLRRVGDSSPVTVDRHTLVAGDLEVHLKEQKASRRGVPIDLSPMEFRLLALLVRETGRAVSHAKLIAHAWGPEYVDCRNYLRLYVRYLRTKLEDDPETPELILNEWGVGYRFEPKLAQI